MLQNREVAGATMGAGSRASAATFGPYGYLSLAVPVGLAALFVSLVPLGLDDPLGLHWSWCSLLFVVTISALSRFAGRRGAEVQARWRSGPRTPAYWTQRAAPWVVGGLLLAIAFGVVGDLPLVSAAATGMAVGATAGVAPAYFERR